MKHYYSKKEKELINKFQSDYFRNLEETFAQIFSENSQVKLFFINENKAFTDGKNIIVDPLFRNIFKDSKALKKVEDKFELAHYLSHNKWNAIRFITRALTVHECLHLLYSRFPSINLKDIRCQSKNGVKVLSFINNIIEDVYIENVGSFCYDNIGIYLKVLNNALLYLSEPSESSFESLEQEILKDKEKVKNLIFFLNYMGTFLKYPDLKLIKPPIDLYNYIEKTKELIIKGSLASTPSKRYYYACEIFDTIKPLIPDDEEIELNLEILNNKFLISTIDNNNSFILPRSGKEQTIPVIKENNSNNILNLEEKNYENLKKQLADIINSFNKENLIYTQNQSYITKKEGKEVLNILNLTNSKDAFNHKKINIKVSHPKINLNYNRAYNNISKKYQSLINKYSTYFNNLLKEDILSQEDGFIFGTGISSKNLGDPKKRYWYRNVSTTDPPELSFLILLDGSGSMRGERIEKTRDAAIILHEVLEKANIHHAIVEHRADPSSPEIQINILKDFDAISNAKYNLFKLHAFYDNRDALALLWCEDYIKRNSYADENTIIIISDGIPSHIYDSYYPPASIEDTRIITSKIIRRGTNVVAVALDDPNLFECYELLKEIYPNIIGCNDLKKLPIQLLKIIEKEILNK